MPQLTLVATPIGNLGDLSPRAIEALGSAALICCEDTRRTGRLLQAAGVAAKRLTVCNEHTERRCVDDVLAVLADGSDVALVTDAGTPGISDPGELLVRAVLDAGFEVSTVPGPVALIVALVSSGLPTTRFVFEGFLPRSGAERRTRLAEIAGEPRTVVLYEAPHRVVRTIGDLTEVCGSDRPGRGRQGADQAVRDRRSRHARQHRTRRSAWRVRDRPRRCAGPSRRRSATTTSPRRSMPRSPAALRRAMRPHELPRRSPCLGDGPTTSPSSALRLDDRSIVDAAEAGGRPVAVRACRY